MHSPIPWRQIQRENIRSLATLCQLLEIQEELVQESKNFPLNIPLRLVQKMEKGKLDDPIFLQFVPLKKKSVNKSFCSDPTGDLSAQKTPKLLHKYASRVLLLASSNCVMNCRYCFRQNFPYQTEASLFAEELAYIASDRSIEEVILSGGDPLSLSNEALKELLTQIESIKHIKRLRFHTRFPVGIPERIDAGFLELLANSSLQVFFVVHINHPRELDATLLLALRNIQKLAIPVLTHTVLLKGVNDSFVTLKELFQTLVNHGILPYYLNQLDKVLGAEAFEVSEEEGLKLMEKLRTELSGYALPTYVRETPGALSKTPI